MPVYEFECLDCRQTFEVRRCFSEVDTPAQCSNCESIQTKRLISNFYAQSSGKSLSSHHSNNGCSGCGGGSCGNCHH